MGTSWLRIAAWIVASASVVGNLAVIIVLSSSRAPMVVSKFLMVNLAIADLFMGIYLFFIAGMDLISSGAYFNFANDWQNGKFELFSSYNLILENNTREIVPLSAVRI